MRSIDPRASGQFMSISICSFDVLIWRSRSELWVKAMAAELCCGWNQPDCESRSM